MACSIRPFPSFSMCFWGGDQKEELEDTYGPHASPLEPLKSQITMALLQLFLIAVIKAMVSSILISNTLPLTCFPSLCCANCDSRGQEGITVVLGSLHLLTTVSLALTSVRGIQGLLSVQFKLYKYVFTPQVLCTGSEWPPVSPFPLWQVLPLSLFSLISSGASGPIFDLHGATATHALARR